MANGNGVLGDLDYEEIARYREEEQRKEAEAAQLEAKRDETTAAIEEGLAPYLKTELSEEIAARKLSPKTLGQYRADFEAFKRCCAEWGLPHLPAPPQAVAIFLAGGEAERGLAHVHRATAAISAVHRAADLPDPCDDLLIRAVVRLVRKEEKAA
jgi:hypothetical protein